MTGPFPNLVAAFPSIEAWVAASPEEMGVVLWRDLRHMRSFSLHNLLATMRERNYHEWGGQAPTEERLGPIAEAYQWLRTVGVIAPSSENPDDFDVIARAARQLDSDSVRGFVAARTSCYALLDHRISDKVWGIYLRGDYDIAVAYAFKVVEVRMREKAGLAASDYGQRLIKKFFTAFNSEIPPEEKGVAHIVHLLIGAFDRYRNEASHLDVSLKDSDEALEVLLLANHCLRIVERAANRT
jgi:uncharacterized protein (TIGR02391 family)